MLLMSINQQMNGNRLTQIISLWRMVRGRAVFCRLIFFAYTYTWRNTEVISSKVGCHIVGKPVNKYLNVCRRFSFTRTFLVCPAKFTEYLCYIGQLLIFKYFLTPMNLKQWFLNHIEPPYWTSQRILCVFPNFTVISSQLEVVDNFKYLGHLISSKSGDNNDIMHQMRLLFARTNVLLRKLNKCNTDVKFCLFKAFCVSFYGMATWHLYNATVMQRFEA